jgi:cupin fold WbuC family metalloprotein
MEKNINQTKYFFKNKSKFFSSFSKKDLKFYFMKKEYQRINFHKNFYDTNQEMIIYRKNKNIFFPPKKYLNTDQSFLILKGKILMLIFNNSGKIIKKIILDKNNFFLRVRKKVLHCDIPLTKNVIHLESNTVSFKKRKIVFLKKKIYKRLLKKYANQK